MKPKTSPRPIGPFPRRIHTHFPPPEPLEARIAPATIGFPGGTNGFTFTGVNSGDDLGTSATILGDVNGDGFDDVLVGAPGFDRTGSANAGEAFVLFGGPGPFHAYSSADMLDGTNGFRIIRGASTGQTGLGSIVSGIGDLNGDGFDDFTVFAPSGEISGGTFYVIFGKATGFGTELDVDTLDGENGFRIPSPVGTNSLGAAVAGAGDVNGDGFDDMILGFPPAGESSSGAVHIVFGKPTGFAAAIDLANLDGTDGFALIGEAANDRIGVAVSGAGDFNGDGFDDILIGAPFESTNGLAAGAAYAVFGRAGGFDPSMNLSALTATTGIKLLGASPDAGLGSYVAGLGDFNGDGVSDIAVAGTISYVVYGKSNFASSTVNLSDLTEKDGIVIPFAGGVAAAGDVDGDGRADLFQSSGLILGNANGSAIIDRVASRFPGLVVPLRGGGDVNGDGFDDILAPAIGIVSSGSVSVIFGTPPSLSVLGTSVPEGSFENGFANVIVTLSSPRTEPVTVTVATSDGTAIAGEDYISLPPTVLTFAPGETTQTVSVPLIGDRTFESDEFFKVHLSNPTVAVIFAGDAGVAITNDDPMPAVSVTNYFIEEGGPGHQAEVAVYFSLSNPSDFPVSFDMTTGDGTARADHGDYAPLSGILEFAPGETAKTVNLTTFGDAIFERNETFTLSLSSPQNATIAKGDSTITILDDDPMPTVIAAPLSVPEGDRGLAAHAVRLTLSNPSAFPASVSVSTVDGTAVALDDYFPFFDELVTFAPGMTEATIPVRVVGNTIDQSDRSFAIELAEAVELKIGTATQEITIVDDDQPEVFSSEFSYRDVDGDMVTVRTDRGAWSHEDYVLEPAGAMGGFRLAHLDFTNHSAEFAGANIRIKVDPVLGGDGRVSVGRIDALGVDLRSVKVSGHLDGISAGDADANTFGLRHLKVDSLGGGGEVSEFVGGAKRITVAGDVSTARIIASGEGAGFGKIKVGGNWTAADLAAGAEPGDDGFFGTSDDDLLAANGNLISRISQIVIGGVILGTDSPDDHFGFVAAEIGKFKAGGTKQPLTAAGRDVIELSADITLRELA